MGCGDIGRNVARRLKALGAACVRGICRAGGPRPGFDETYPTTELASALDVFEAEPLPADDALWDMGNVIVTPHVAGWDDDLVNVQAMFELFSDNLVRYLDGRELTHVVDRARGY